MPTFKVENLAQVLPCLLNFVQSLALLNHGLGHRLVIPECKQNMTSLRGRLVGSK